MLGEQADQRRAREERRVADRADHRDAGRGAGGVVGRRAHPDREAQRRRRRPRTAPRRARPAWTRPAAPAAGPPARSRPSRAAPRRGRSAPAARRRPARPTVIAATNRPNAIAPTVSLEPWPSTSATAIQSLADPSVNANASTSSPTSSVRGSRHACSTPEPFVPCSGAGAVRGRKRRVDQTMSSGDSTAIAPTCAAIGIAAAAVGRADARRPRPCRG